MMFIFSSQTVFSHEVNVVMRRYMAVLLYGTTTDCEKIDCHPSSLINPPCRHHPLIALRLMCVVQQVVWFRSMSLSWIFLMLRAEQRSRLQRSVQLPLLIHVLILFYSHVLLFWFLSCLELCFITACFPHVYWLIASVISSWFVSAFCKLFRFCYEV